VYHLESENNTCLCPVCGNTISADNIKLIKELKTRKYAQKEFGRYIVVNRSNAPKFFDLVFFHCNSVRSAKYSLTQRTKEFKNIPNDWSQHLDFVFVAEPVELIFKKKDEPDTIDISTILGKITYIKRLTEGLFWKADYHGLDCADSDCSCKDKTHEKLFLPINNNIETSYHRLYKLIYKAEPPVKEHYIWDRFESINKMLDQLFTISEEHGLLGAPASCSCNQETHLKIRSEIEDKLDEIMIVLD
jgi:hypothetical protein